MENQNSVTYAEAGVDIVEGARAVDAIKDTVQSTYRPEVVGDIGGFGGLFSIAVAKDMVDPLLVSGTDGVGTKLKVAQRLGVHDTVGIDLVAMSLCSSSTTWPWASWMPRPWPRSSAASAKAAASLAARSSAARWPSIPA